MVAYKSSTVPSFVKSPNATCRAVLVYGPDAGLVAERASALAQIFAQRAKGPTEVVRLDEDEHRAAPDQQQRPEVLQPSLCEHLALLAQVAGEEDDQENLRELARLELERADVDP